MLHAEAVKLGAQLQRFEEVASRDSDSYNDKIKPLIESDNNSGAAYVDTLRAYLDSSGASA